MAGDFVSFPSCGARPSAIDVAARSLRIHIDPVFPLNAIGNVDEVVLPVVAPLVVASGVVLSRCLSIEVLRVNHRYNRIRAFRIRANDSRRASIAGADGFSRVEGFRGVHWVSRL